MFLTVEQAQILVEQILKVSQSRHMSGIQRVLRRLRILCEADGCVLWLWTQYWNQAEAPKRARLFAAAANFDERKDLFWHILMPDSPSTQAARSGIPQKFTDLPVGGNDPDYDAMRRLGVRSFCAIPVWWPSAGDSGMSMGTVNFYRCREGAFSEAAFAMARELAKLVPQALSVILNHASFHLLQRVTDELSAAQVAEDNSKLFAPDLQRALGPVLKEVQDSFNCFEVSLYLTRPWEADGRLHKVNLPEYWPWNQPQPASYRQGEGLTGYCASRCKPICIFDLGRFDEDIEFIHEEYPDLQWSRPFDFEAAARVKLPVNEAGKLQPLSFMAAPILDERNVLGVLRCCTTMSEPFYFNQRQLELLCLVANLIGQWCGDRYQLRRAAERREMLQNCVQGISELNSRAHETMMSQRPGFESLIQEALEIAHKAVPQATGLAVHVADSEQKSLRCRGAVGTAWQAGTAAEAKRRRGVLLPLDAGHSAAADAFLLNKAIRISNLETESRYRCTLFPPAKALVVAPISSGAKKYGVLSAIFEATDPYMDQAAAVVELLGLQLGLYRVLGDNLSELWATKEESEKRAEQQLQTFENLQHQLRTPVYVAHLVARRLASRPRRVDPDVTNLRSQIRRAEQVLANIRMFADLARGNVININRAIVHISDLIGRLEEAVSDHNAVMDPSSKIQFCLDTKSFSALDGVRVSVDLALMDQMVHCLLDNAGKYSDLNSSVTVRGSLAERGQVFYLSVLNKGSGSRVSARMAQTLAERGTRGDRALWQNKEGWGLGLYIVREILEAHRGKLQIIPTMENEITEFRLVFPTNAQ